MFEWYSETNKNELFEEYWGKISKTKQELRGFSVDDWQVIEKSYYHHLDNEKKCSVCSPYGRYKPWKCPVWLIYSEAYDWEMERRGMTLLNLKSQKTGEIDKHGYHWCKAKELNNCQHDFTDTIEREKKINWEIKQYLKL